MVYESAEGNITIAVAGDSMITHRGGIHDMAEALPEHHLVGSLDAVGHAADVHVVDVVPIFNLVVADLAADGDPGVVEDVVEPPVGFRRFIDETLYRAKIPDVEQEGVGFPAP